LQFNKNNNKKCNLSVPHRRDYLLLLIIIMVVGRGKSCGISYNYSYNYCCHRDKIINEKMSTKWSNDHISTDKGKTSYIMEDI